VDRQVGGAEQAIADVADDHRVLVEEFVDPVEQTLHGDGAARPDLERSLGRLSHPLATGLRGRHSAGQLVDEQGQRKIIVMMPFDADAGRVGVDRTGHVEPGRVNAEVDVGHEGTQDQQAVGAFHGALRALLTHGTLVDADVLRVVLSDDRLSQQGGRDGKTGALDELQQPFLKLKPVDLHAGEDHRPPGCAEHLGRVGGGLLQGGAILFVGRRASEP